MNRILNNHAKVLHLGEQHLNRPCHSQFSAKIQRSLETTVLHGKQQSRHGPKKPFPFRVSLFLLCGSQLNSSQSRSALNGYHSSRTSLPRSRFWRDETKNAARETMTGLSLAGGGFSNDNGDGSENVSVKTSSHVFKLCRKYFSLLKTSNVGKFSWNLIIRDQTQI